MLGKSTFSALYTINYIDVPYVIIILLSTYRCTREPNIAAKKKNTIFARENIYIYILNTSGKQKSRHTILLQGEEEKKTKKNKVNSSLMTGSFFELMCVCLNLIKKLILARWKMLSQTKIAVVRAWHILRGEKYFSVF